MTAEERAEMLVDEYWPDQLAASVIAAAIRTAEEAATLAERARCAKVCRDTQAELDREFSPEGCTDTADEAAERIEAG